LDKGQQGINPIKDTPPLPSAGSSKCFGHSLHVGVLRGHERIESLHTILDPIPHGDPFVCTIVRVRNRQLPRPDVSSILPLIVPEEVFLCTAEPSGTENTAILRIRRIVAALAAFIMSGDVALESPDSMRVDPSFGNTKEP
jgi:hypothetical protein